jgi:hypothetical protein
MGKASEAVSAYLGKLPNFRIVTKVTKYGREVYEHSAMDALRKTDCLCLNCAKMSECPIAEAGFELCQEYGVAYAMTRCPLFERKPDSPLTIVP